MHQFAIILLAALATLTSCSQRTAIPDEFIGHFISDRDATIAKWREDQPWGEHTDETIASLSPILGKTEIISDGVHFTVNSERWTETEKIQYLSIHGLTAETKSYSHALDRNIIAKMEADSNGYWHYSDDPLPNYCERFKRIK